MAQACISLKASELTEVAHIPCHAEVEGRMTFECRDRLIPFITGDTFEGLKVANFVHFGF